MHMKSSTWFMVIGFFVSSFAFAQTTPTPISPWYSSYDFSAKQCSLYLPLEDSLTDYATPSRTFNRNGGSFVDGRLGRCWHSNWGNWFKASPFNQNGLPKSFSCWLRIQSVPIDGSKLICNWSPPTQPGYCLGFTGPSSSLPYKFMLNPSRTIGRNDEAFGRVSVGLWFHICVVVMQDKVYHYINGSLDSIADYTFATPNQSNNSICFAGEGNGDWWGGFDGEMDDIAFFDKALSASEVAALALDANSNGIADFWDFGAAPKPILNVPESSLNFETLEGQDPAAQIIHIQNKGGGTLRWEAHADDPRYVLNSTSGTGDAEITCQPLVSDLLPQEDDALVTIVNLDAPREPALAGKPKSSAQVLKADSYSSAQKKTVPVNLRVNPNLPAIGLSAKSVLIKDLDNQPQSQETLTLQNSGGGILRWSAVTPTGGSWLSIQPTSGQLGKSAKQTITLTATRGALANGKYSGSIRISDTTGRIPSANVTVGYQVRFARRVYASKAYVVLPSGRTYSQNVNISRSRSDVDWDVALPSDAPAWVTDVRRVSSSKAVVDLDTSSLSAREEPYTCFIPITSHNATNLPQSIPLTVRISNYPVAPTVLQTTALSYDSVKLKWKYPCDTASYTNPFCGREEGFRLYRAPQATGPYELIADNLNPSLREYEDNSGLLPASTYFYKMSAYSHDGDKLLESFYASGKQSLDKGNYVRAVTPTDLVPDPHVEITQAVDGCSQLICDRNTVVRWKLNTQVKDSKQELNCNLVITPPIGSSQQSPPPIQVPFTAKDCYVDSDRFLNQDHATFLVPSRYVSSPGGYGFMVFASSRKGQVFRSALGGKHFVKGKQFRALGVNVTVDVHDGKCLMPNFEKCVSETNDYLRKVYPILNTDKNDVIVASRSVTHNGRIDSDAASKSLLDTLAREHESYERETGSNVDDCIGFVSAAAIDPVTKELGEHTPKGGTKACWVTDRLDDRGWYHAEDAAHELGHGNGCGAGHPFFTDTKVDSNVYDIVNSKDARTNPFILEFMNTKLSRDYNRLWFWIGPEYYSDIVSHLSEALDGASIRSRAALASGGNQTTNTITLTLGLSRNDVVINPAIRMSDNPRISDSMGGNYAVSVLNDLRTSTYTLVFEPQWTTEYYPNGDAPLSFHRFTLPKPEDAGRIVIAHNDVVLETLGPTANKPMIQVLSPREGDAITSQVTVAWDAFDPDGTPLSEEVFFSNDGGNTYQYLTRLVNAGEWRVARSLLPGGRQCKFRIRVCDGWFTTQAESRGFFEIPNTTPTLTIVLPEDGAEFLSPTTTTMEMSVLDMEDDQPSTESMTWTSSMDGFLGQGRHIERVLSPGNHILTARATDRDGAPTTASLEVIVYADEDGDGMADWWESQYDVMSLLVDDSLEDPDGDGIPNVDEYLYRTDPGNADTDGDGVDDRMEIQEGTDPTDPLSIPFRDAWIAK